MSDYHEKFMFMYIAEDDSEIEEEAFRIPGRGNVFVIVGPFPIYFVLRALTLG